MAKNSKMLFYCLHLQCLNFISYSNDSNFNNETKRGKTRKEYCIQACGTI